MILGCCRRDANGDQSDIAHVRLPIVVLLSSGLHEFGSARFPSGLGGPPRANGEKETKSGQITKPTPALRSPSVLPERDAGGTGADEQADCGECPRNAEDRWIDLGELARHGSGERILEANHLSFRHRGAVDAVRIAQHAASEPQRCYGGCRGGSKNETTRQPRPRANQVSYERRSREQIWHRSRAGFDQGNRKRTATIAVPNEHPSANQ